MRLRAMAFFSVRTTWSCPTISSNVWAATCAQAPGSLWTRSVSPSRNGRGATQKLQPQPGTQSSGQAPHGTGRTSLPLLPSGPGGVHAPVHAWDLAKAHGAPPGGDCNTYLFAAMAIGFPWVAPASMPKAVPSPVGAMGCPRRDPQEAAAPSYVPTGLSPGVEGVDGCPPVLGGGGPGDRSRESCKSRCSCVCFCFLASRRSFKICSYFVRCSGVSCAAMSVSMRSRIPCAVSIDSWRSLYSSSMSRFTMGLMCSFCSGREPLVPGDLLDLPGDPHLERRQLRGLPARHAVAHQPAANAADSEDRNQHEADLPEFVHGDQEALSTSATGSVKPCSSSSPPADAR